MRRRLESAHGAGKRPIEIHPRARCSVTRCGWIVPLGVLGARRSKRFEVGSRGRSDERLDIQPQISFASSEPLYVGSPLRSLVTSFFPAPYPKLNSFSRLDRFQPRASCTLSQSI